MMEISRTAIAVCVALAGVVSMVAVGLLLDDNPNLRAGEFSTPEKNWEGVFTLLPDIHDASRGSIVVAPNSIDEIQHIVRHAAKEGKRIKVVGAGHSWSDIAVARSDSKSDTGSGRFIILLLHRLNRLISVDASIEQSAGYPIAFVQAGCTLQHLVDTLSTFGLSLPFLPSVTGQTVAGALATATHGSGLRVQNLAARIVELHLVDHSGQIRVFTELGNSIIGEDGLLSALNSSITLPMVAAHLGAHGIVVAMKIRCAVRSEMRSLKVRESMVKVNSWKYWGPDTSDLEPLWLESAKEHRFAKWWWFPYTGTTMEYVADPHCLPDTPKGSVPRGSSAVHATYPINGRNDPIQSAHDTDSNSAGTVRSDGIDCALDVGMPIPRSWSERFEAWMERTLARSADAIQWVSRTFPSLIPEMNRLTVALGFPERRIRFGRYDTILAIPYRIPPHSEVEYAVPGSKAAAYMKELFRVFEIDDPRGSEYLLNFMFEVRVVAADTVWMSPDYEYAADGTRESFFLHITMLQNGDLHSSLVRKPFEKIEQISLSFGGRPHWAKTFYAGPAELKSVYPARWEEWQAVRTELDPDGLFENEYLSRTFG